MYTPGMNKVISILSIKIFRSSFSTDVLLIHSQILEVAGKKPNK